MYNLTTNIQGVQGVFNSTGNLKVRKLMRLAAFELVKEAFPNETSKAANPALPEEVREGSNVMTRLTHEETTVYESGNQIGAIKLVRARTNCGLKEAKDLVEAEASRRNLVVKSRY